MSTLENDAILTAVRDNYGRIAESSSSCCGRSSACCTPAEQAGPSSSRLGYAAADLITLPDGADLGLGCGNPQAIAALSAGETVLDLGSGAGIDCFLAAAQVGPTGRAIGVDMTPAMITKARANADQGAYPNVEFRLGEIEHLPVADASIDVIISNCVINLSPDKAAVFAEAFRVLRPGGRLAISDVVAVAELPEEYRADLALFSGCVSGAAQIHEIEHLLQAAGFQHIRIAAKDESRAFMADWAPGTPITDYVLSATIEAHKPTA